MFPYCRQPTWNLETLSWCNISENTTNQDDPVGKLWWWTKTKSPRRKRQLDYHHHRSRRAVKPILHASVPPESERQRQQNQDANKREAPRNWGTKVCCGFVWYCSCIIYCRLWKKLAWCGGGVAWHLVTKCAHVIAVAVFFSIVSVISESREYLEHSFVYLNIRW